jgi:hypothetical protein
MQAPREKPLCRFKQLDAIQLEPRLIAPFARRATAPLQEDEV